MTITAKVIADSLSPAGARITSIQLRYHRFIHSEVMTHRAFSRNSSSSRAIPIKRLIAYTLKDPAVPTYWGSNKPGMQAGKELTGWSLFWAKFAWHGAKHAAVFAARLLSWAGVHKQIANRVLEPFSHITVLVTSTEWGNFLELRDHPDAQPEIRVLAKAIREALEGSLPRRKRMGQWHLPYISFEDWVTAMRMPKDDDMVAGEIVRRVSVARCARVSYKTHDGKPTKLEDDLALFDKLIVAEPLHASPAEHQAVPAEAPDAASRNFRGWVQYRAIIEAAA